MRVFAVRIGMTPTEDDADGRALGVAEAFGVGVLRGEGVLRGVGVGVGAGPATRTTSATSRIHRR